MGAPPGHGHTLRFLDARLDAESASLARGYGAVCAFVNDKLDAPVMERLAALGVKCVAMRCAGFNNVDLKAAARLEIPVVRVPAYSPYAVAEHALGLMLALAKNIGVTDHAMRRDRNLERFAYTGRGLRGRTQAVLWAIFRARRPV